MIYKNEKSLINIIKYTPFIFIISLSLIISISLYFQKQNELEIEKESIKKEYLEKNQELIKSEVENLYNFIIRTQEKTEEKLKNSIRQRVLEANNIANRIYNENKDTKTKNEIIKMIKDALVDIRFNDGRGYIFIYGFDYECILLPINRENEGKSVYDFQDSKGLYLGREIVKSLQNKDEAFLTWHYPKPENLEKKDFKKIGFNVHFKPYDWFIGSGEYVVDFEENMKEEILEYISKLKTNENDYFFILDYDKKSLFQKIDNLVDKSFQKISSDDEMNLFNEILDLSKNGGGFITYNYKIIDETTALTKTSYVKALLNWKWIIGKGFFHDYVNKIIEKKSIELNEKFHKKIKNIFIITLILTLILLSISIYISKKLEKKFQDYKMELKKQQHILAQQSKMAAMGEMLGNIAHQWRQPLNNINLLIYYIRDSYGLISKEELNETIKNAKLQIDFMSQTIDDFRNFYKPSKEKKLFNIKDSIIQSSKIVKSSLERNSIELKIEAIEIEIENYENEFEQVIVNILNNAIDAKIIKDKTTKFKAKIEIKIYKENENIFISIFNNCGNIDETIIERIFEPYFTTKFENQGTGIGLYMTKVIIEKNMKGKIEATNKDDGVEFLIKLNA